MQYLEGVYSKTLSNKPRNIVACYCKTLQHL